jgi:hypothetical protein
MKQGTGKFVRMYWYVDNSLLDFKDMIMSFFPRIEVLIPIQIPIMKISLIGCNATLPDYVESQPRKQQSNNF